MKSNMARLTTNMFEGVLRFLALLAERKFGLKKGEKLCTGGGAYEENIQMTNPFPMQEMTKKMKYRNPRR